MASDVRDGWERVVSVAVGSSIIFLVGALGGALAAFFGFGLPALHFWLAAMVVLGVEVVMASLILGWGMARRLRD
jgi:hypothetical protein